MPKFIVSADAAPGVARAGVGFFEPGDTIELPDSVSRPGEKISLRLIPVDQEAYDVLAAIWPEAASENKIAKPIGEAPTKKVAVEPMTVAEAVEQHHVGRKSKRAADR